MTIAAITENYTEDELRTFFPGEGIEWRLSPRVEEVPGAEVYFDLDFVPEKRRCEALNRLRPALIIVNAVTPTLQEMGYPFVRINGWPGFLGRSIHELVVGGGDRLVVPDGEMDPHAAAITSRIAELYHRLGRDYRLVPDVPGMISARILSTIINEAYFTWEAGVSTKEEIDTAMRLGTNYPLGPFEWSERIGLGQIAGLLGLLSRTSPVYVPSQALIRAAEGLKID